MIPRLERLRKPPRVAQVPLVAAAAVGAVRDLDRADEHPTSEVLDAGLVGRERCVDVYTLSEDAGGFERCSMRLVPSRICSA